MNLCTAGTFFKHALFPNVGKTNILVGDETKHVVLLIFNALYMCLTVEDLHDTEKKSRNGSNVSTI